MGRRGRHAVEEQFNWDREERKLLAFYRSITDGRDTLNAPNRRTVMIAEPVHGIAEDGREPEDYK